MRNSVILSNTDTALGFLSQDKKSLDEIKNREPNKHYITTLSSFANLKERVRVPQKPQKYKNRVRRSSRTTFIMPNKKSFRVVSQSKHLLLLNRFGWLYSTSANQSGKSYNQPNAIEQSQITIYPLQEEINKPSKIYLLSEKLKKIR